MLRKKSKPLAILLLLFTMLLTGDTTPVNASTKVVPVRYEKTGAYSVTLPLSIAIENKDMYKFEVEASGNIRPQEYLLVKPISNDIIFTHEKLEQFTLDGYINQDETSWNREELTNGVTTTSTIFLDDIKAGKYNASVEYKIELINLVEAGYYSTSLWSWNQRTITDSEYQADFFTFCIANDIDRVYQCFDTYPTMVNEEQLTTFLEKAKQNNIDVYFTNGDPSFCNRTDYVLDEMVAPIAAYNSNHEVKIKGIVLDEEVYANDDYQENQDEYHQKTVNLSQRVYQACHEAGMEYILCSAANFFEKVPELYDYTDEILVMAYYNGKQAYNVRNIVPVCREKGLSLEIITLFSDTEDNSCRQSIEEATAEWLDVHETYPDIDLRFGIHAYSYFTQ